MSCLYKYMTALIVPPASEDFLQELGKVHEKLYVIFYNCYFSRSVAYLCPRWIKTDLGNAQISRKNDFETKRVKNKDNNTLYKKYQ